MDNRIGIAIEVEGAEEAKKVMQSLEATARELGNDKVKIEFDTKGISKASKTLDSYLDGVQNSLNSMNNRLAKSGESAFSRIGSNLQTLGNALTNFSSIYDNVIGSIVSNIGYNALNTVSSGLENSFDRYDILKSYPKYMDEFSKKTYTANDSIKELDESVLGLPTSLSEITEMAQKYTLSLGDMRRGTKLAIASNNAFLASNATDEQQYQGMQQLQDLMNGKDLTSKEWMSLNASMGYAINKIGQQLGYVSTKKFRRELYAGEIATEDFLDALIKVGNEGGDVAKKAAISAMQWKAVSKNIKTAMSRLGANALMSMDTIFAEAGKGSFLQYVYKARDGIDNLGTSLQKWIGNHSDEILSFFDKIAKYDWGGLLSSYAGTYLNQLKRLGVLFNVDSSFLGHAMAWISILGRITTMAGGLIKGSSDVLSAIFEWRTRLKILSGLSISSKTISLVSKLTSVFKGLAKAGKVNIGKVFAGLSATKLATKLKGLAQLTGTARKAEKGAEALGEAGTALAGASISWQGVASKAVSFAGIIGIMVALKPAAKAMQTLSKIKVSGDMGQAIVGMVTTITALSTLATAIGLALETPMAAVGAGVGAGLILAISKSIQWFADGMKTLVQAVDSLNNIEVPSLSKVEQIVSAISTLTEGIWNIGSGDSESSNLIDNIPVVGTINSGAKALKAVFQAIKASGVTSLINKIGSTTKTMQKLANLKIDPESFETNVSNVIEAIDVAFREFDGDYEFGDVIMSFVDKWKASNIDEAFNLLKSTVKSVTTIGDTEMPSTEKIGQQIGSVFKIYTSIEEQLKESFGTKGGKGAKDLSRGGVVVTDYSSQLSTIDGMISAVTGMITSLSNAKTTLESTEGLLDKNGNLDTSFLTNACENIFKVFNELTGAEGGTNWFGKLTNLQNKIDDVDFDGKLIPAIDGIKNVVSKLQSIKESVSGGDGKDKGGEGGGDLIPQSIKDAFGDLEGLATDLIKADPATLQSNATALQSAITSIKTVITDLQGMNTGGEGEGDGGGTSLATIAKQLKDALAELNGIGEITIDGTINDQLTGKLEEALKAIKEAIKKITDLGKTYTVNVTIDGSVSYGGFLQSINDAYDTLSSALGKLKNLGGTPTIGDNTSAHTGGYIGSTGAVLYRAKGGTIFKRKGTDTVPAMLTPGEYVMRRRAVNAYGARFMQHLNNLDLGGALRSLSLRTGSNLIPQGMTIYNNRTTNNNNNARVTQNITTNNPNFAFMRANRFVGAL